MELDHAESDNLAFITSFGIWLFYNMQDLYEFKSDLMWSISDEKFNYEIDNHGPTFARVWCFR